MNPPNQVLADLIQEAGFSLAGFARRVNELGRLHGLDPTYDYTAVYRWTRRGEKPRGSVPSLLAEVLAERLGRQIFVEDLGPSMERRTEGSADVAVTGTGNEPTDIARLISAASIGQRDVDFIERSVTRLAARYPRTGPSAIWPELSVHIDRLQAVLSRSQRLSIQRRCVQLLGMLAGMAGNVWVDLGQRAKAERYFDLGRVASQETVDDDLAAWVNAIQSIDPFYADAPQYAIDLLDHARALAIGKSGPRRRAWITALLARAYAATDPSHAMALLEEAFNQLSQADPPSAVDFFDSTRLNGLAGTVYLLTGDTVAAAEAAATALASRAESDLKGRTLATLDLAACRIAEGEPEDAAHHVREALRISDGQLVAPIAARARSVVAGMRRWRDTATTRHLGEQVRAAAISEAG